jgi:hypothetical protein
VDHGTYRDVGQLKSVAWSPAMMVIPT